VIFLPISNRLKGLSTDEVALRTLTIDGILAVQAGDNPRIVQEKLISYVPPVERSAADGEGGAATLKQAA
jgi:chemotaxis protein MotA